MKINEERFNNSTIVRYKIKRINSLKEIIKFVHNINATKNYNVGAITFSDVNNSSDDGNKSSVTEINEFNNLNYSIVEKKYSDVDIDSIDFVVKSGTKSLDIVIEKTYDILVIFYSDKNELLYEFEKDFNLLEE